MSIPDEGYSRLSNLLIMSVPNDGYSWNNHHQVCS
jgi:hypothetical protein